MRLPGPKWWMPSHFERRHIGRWLSRCWHWRVMYPLDNYSTKVLEDITDMIRRVASLPSMPDHVELTQSQVDALRINSLQDIDLNFTGVFNPNGLLGVPVIIRNDFIMHDYPFTSDINREPFRFIERVDGSPWLRRKPMGGFNRTNTHLMWFIRSECHDAPVFVAENFPMDCFFVHCGECGIMLDNATGEGIWELERDPSLVDSTVPPTV